MTTTSKYKKEGRKMKSRMRTFWHEDERVLLIQIKVELPKRPLKVKMYARDNISSI